MKHLKLIAVLFLACAIAFGAVAVRQKVTQKIRYREIQKGTAELIWRQGDGYEWFTIRVPAGTWQLICIYPDGWEFVARTVQGGEYVSQWRDAEFPLDFRLVQVK
jgi:hypothetical protein